MKVAKLYSFEDIRIEDVPIPEIGPGDALIRTKACGICSGDVMPWYIEQKAPLVIGHEPTGEIVEIGREAAALFKPGDRVFAHHHAPCMSCKCCLRGDYVQCETWRSSKIIPGGISEYILVPEINLRNDTLRLPEDVSFESGVLMEPAACVVKSLRRSNIKRGDTVFIIGLGVMGQLHVQLAREFGAGAIIGADMVPYRLQIASAFGADHVIDVKKYDALETLKDLTDGRMADIVIVGPNSAAAMRQGIKSAARGGTVTFFTPAKPGERLELDPNALYFNDVNLVTSYSCGPDDTSAALGYIQKGVISPEKLITHRFRIGDSSKAFRMTAEGGDSLKSIIVF